MNPVTSSSSPPLPTETVPSERQPSAQTLPRSTHSAGPAYLALVLVTVVWSVNFTAVKRSLEEIDPYAFCFGRGFLSAIVFGGWLLATRGRAAFALEHLRVAAGPALFGIAANQICFVVGLGMTNPPHSAVAISTIPIFVAIFAVVTRLERFSAAAAGGILLAFFGLFEINRLRGFELDPRFFAGDVVTLGSAVTFAVYTLLMKQALRRYEPMHLIALAYVIATLMQAPVTAGSAFAQDWSGLSTAAWGGLLFATIFATLLAYFLHTWALVRIPASKVAAFTYCQPVLATAIAWGWRGDPISDHFVAGGVAVLAGVALAQWGRR